MKYDVLWFQDVVDQLFDLAARQPRQASRILLTVRSFGRDGHGDVKKLEGRKDEWRLRAGDWRIHLILNAGSACVTKVDNRRDSYQAVRLRDVATD